MPTLSRLNVAVVAPSLGILGGQSVQADRLLRAWQNDEDVHAWLVPVNPVPPRLLRFASRIKYLRTVVTQLTYLPQLVRELSKADVVHVFSASYSSFLLAPLPALVVARALGRPVLLNYRSGEAPDHLARSAIARTALARVQKNVVPSPFLVDVFRQFQIEAAVVPNLVDLDRFQYRERKPLRPRLLSTRNFDDLYNVACTLRAFSLVQQQWPDATLTLVGGGPNEASLRSMVGALGVNHVVFSGRIAPDQIASCYSEHDIYIQSPNIDNTPTSVLEAFASGLPVVSTDAGGIPRILTHAEHGLLAPVDDHARLAAHVLHLLAHPEDAVRMAGAARETCHACAWPAVRELWLLHYRSLTRGITAQTVAGPDRLRPPLRGGLHRTTTAALALSKLETMAGRHADDHAE